nr:reverse transcriptase domain-containing protein [Tanacetum cinerariifolium]
SNNEAEYEALVAGLQIAARMGVKNVQVLVEVLKNKSIKEKEVATVIEEDGPTWMTQLVDYLKGGVLPGDKKEARKLCLKARQYAEYVIREIHKWSCSMYAGPRSVVAKAIRLRPRTLVKGQILADFLIEMPDDVSQAVPAAETQEEPWTLFTDGSLCVDGSGAEPRGSRIHLRAEVSIHSLQQ